MNKEKIGKYLLIGLIGAVITVIGEMAQGLAETVAHPDPMIAMFATHASVAGWRHGFGSTAGALGIMLQFFGMYAIYLSFGDPQARSSRRFRYGAVIYSLVGAGVHILMASAVYVYKINSDALMEYMLWFVLPITAIFLVAYTWFSVIMFQKFRKGETGFPTWCCVLNPLLGKAVINLLAELIPVSVLANGVGYSNMGITAVIMFAVLYGIARKEMK